MIAQRCAPLGVQVLMKFGVQGSTAGHARDTNGLLVNQYRDRNTREFQICNTNTSSLSVQLNEWCEAGRILKKEKKKLEN